MTAPSTGTIDVTDLVESMRQSWVKWADSEIDAAVLSIPGIGGIVLWLYNWLGSGLVNMALNYISKKDVMLVSFMNTAVKKASQAKDYTDALKASNSLPSTATKQEFANVENNEILQFRNFVVITN